MSKPSIEQSDVKETAQYNRNFGEALIEKSPINGTPFTYIHNKETNTGMITLGNYIIRNNYKSKEEAEESLPNVNNWELLLDIISAITYLTNKALKNG